MALEALGIDPAIGTTRNYIADITSRFDGTQFGDTNEVNDDMFALIALAHAGYDATDAHIAAAVSFIISKQSVSGSWGSVDLTAAGMLALAPFRTLPGVTAAIDKAKSSLHAAQQADGGFGSSFATSWVLNAINGLSGEVLSRDWSKGGRTPADYLWLLQQTDGGIGEPSLDTNSRVWATAYALTGGSGKDWNAVLGSFSRHVSGATQSGGGGGEVLGATTASSSETKSATSTEVSTKATLVIATASSTEQLMLTDTVGTTSTSISLSKATSTPSKAKGGKIKKKIIPKEIMKQTASVTSAAPTVPVAPIEAKKEDKGIVSFIRDPFARFFQLVGSWF